MKVRIGKPESYDVPTAFVDDHASAVLLQLVDKPDTKCDRLQTLHSHWIFFRPSLTTSEKRKEFHSLKELCDSYFIVQPDKSCERRSTSKELLITLLVRCDALDTC